MMQKFTELHNFTHLCNKSNVVLYGFVSLQPSLTLEGNWHTSIFTFYNIKWATMHMQYTNCYIIIFFGIFCTKMTWNWKIFQINHFKIAPANCQISPRRFYVCRHAWVVLLILIVFNLWQKCVIICYMFIEAAKLSLIYNVKFRVVNAFRAAGVCLQPV